VASSNEVFFALAQSPGGSPSPPRASRRRLLVWGGLILALGGSVGVLLLSRRRAVGELRSVIHQAAYAHGLDPQLVDAVVQAESGGNPQAVSRARAYGLMQLRIPTASEMAGRPVTSEELFDPRLNLELGCRYLKRMLALFGHDERLALMAYNAGPRNVMRWMEQTRSTDEILAKHAFPETRAYVRKVLETRG
jgi:soluble lytic murein transglycosylase-like protein